MSIPTLIRAAAVALAAFAAIPPAQAKDVHCLSQDQRRSVSASGKVVPLAKAIRAARVRKTDVVAAQLCKSPKGLVYLLTLLARDGKVTRATVDAASGTLSEGG